MNIPEEIKLQAESAIAIQKDILKSLTTENNPVRGWREKLELINLTFSNVLKIRQALDAVCGEIQIDDFLSESSASEGDETVY